MHAEQQYLFRHAIFRDALYALQLPTRRAELHLLAADAIEALFGDEDTAAELADHLCAARELTGRQDQLEREIRLLELSASQAEAHFDLREALERYLRCADIAAGAEQCEALSKASEVARRSGRYDESEQVLNQLNELGLALGSPHWQRAATIGRVNLRVDLGRMQEAEQLLDAAPPGNYEREAGDTLARLLSTIGRSAEAEAEYRRLIESSRASGDVRREGSALGGLAVVLINTGRGTEADGLLQSALEVARAAGDLRMEGFWTGSLGVRLAGAGKPQEATALLQRALDLARDVGDRRSEGIWLAYVATNAVENGDAAAGERVHLEALAVSREIGDIERESLNLGNLAVLKLDQQDVEAARDLLEAALRLDRRAGNRRFEAAHLCDRGLLHLRCGEPAAARDDWDAGSAMLRRLGDSETLQACLTEMQNTCARLGIEPLE